MEQLLCCWGWWGPLPEAVLQTAVPTVVSSYLKTTRQIIFFLCGTDVEKLSSSFQV